MHPARASNATSNMGEVRSKFHNKYTPLPFQKLPKWGGLTAKSLRFVCGPTRASNSPTKLVKSDALIATIQREFALILKVP